MCKSFQKFINSIDLENCPNTYFFHPVETGNLLKTIKITSGVTSKKSILQKDDIFEETLRKMVKFH